MSIPHPTCGAGIKNRSWTRPVPVPFSSCLNSLPAPSVRPVVSGHLLTSKRLLSRHLKRCPGNRPSWSPSPSSCAGSIACSSPPRRPCPVGRRRRIAPPRPLGPPPQAATRVQAASEAASERAKKHAPDPSGDLLKGRLDCLGFFRILRTQTWW